MKRRPSTNGEVPKLPADVLIALRRVPGRLREEARQEAYLATFEGRDPLLAVLHFADKELLHEERERTSQKLEDLPVEDNPVCEKYIPPPHVRRRGGRNAEQPSLEDLGAQANGHRPYPCPAGCKRLIETTAPRIL